MAQRGTAAVMVVVVSSVHSSQPLQRFSRASAGCSVFFNSQSKTFLFFSEGNGSFLLKSQLSLYFSIEISTGSLLFYISLVIVFFLHIFDAKMPFY